MRPLPVIVLVVLAALADAKPLPKNETLPVKYPSISGPCNWGQIEQKGKDFTIVGNSAWSAYGTVTPDGRVSINWSNLPLGTPAVGVYQLNKDGSITGHWQWEASIEIGPDGEPSNIHNRETVRHAKETEEPL